MENEELIEDVVEENGNNLFNYSEDGEIIEGEKEEFLPQDLSNVPLETWSIQGIWNDISNMERKEPKQRDYISFGDVGKKDYWSRYMKMTGVPESNPPDTRVMRIFQAGHEFHDLIKTVFKKAGIFINSQDDDKEGQPQFTIIEGTDKILKQLGKYDILVGGKPDKEKAFKWIEQSDLSDFMKEKAKKITEFFADKFPNGLKEMIYEIKSINSTAFWGKKDYLYEAYPHHKLQLWGNLKGNNISEGRLLYVSKDDLSVAEFPIFLNDKNLEREYMKDVEAMSYYIMNKIEPPKPSYVVFNKRKIYSFQNDKKKYKIKGSYEINWEVIRSSYFTKMTGLKTDKELEMLVKDEISEKNKKIKQKILENLELKGQKINNKKTKK